jgi:hypothetical protein
VGENNLNITEYITEYYWINYWIFKRGWEGWVWAGGRKQPEHYWIYFWILLNILRNI